MSKLEFNVIPWSDGSMEKYQWLDICLQDQSSTTKEFHPAWQAYRYLLCGKMYAYIGIDERNGRPYHHLEVRAHVQ